MRYILTIDAGTTSIRAVLFDTKNYRVKRFVREASNLIEPKDSWVEQDANLIYLNAVKCLKEVTKKIKIKDIYGLGIANQRETVVAWERNTGKPLYNAIIWKCRRTADYCKQLHNDKNFCNDIYKKTGLIVNSYFSATKIKWLIDNVDAVKQAIKDNNICFGTIETYLVYRLTSLQTFVTDVTNASRTMLFNIHTLDWDDDLLKYFSIEKQWLAKPVANDEIVGTTHILGEKVKIGGLIGDQQSSLLGQLCIDKGQTKVTYGTGCFMLCNVGSRPKQSKHNLLTTVAYKINNKVNYALEGSIFSGGSIMNWLIDQKVAKDHNQLFKLAMKESTNDVILIPAFNGLGAPYWKMDAQMKYVYFTDEITRSKLAKSGFDAIAYRTHDILKAMESDLKTKIKKVRVDGGQSMNKYLMSRLSDVLQTEIQIMNIESTCMGCIIATMIAFKAIRQPHNLKYILRPMKIYHPKDDKSRINKEIKRWEKVISDYLKGK